MEVLKRSPTATLLLCTNLPKNCSLQLICTVCTTSSFIGSSCNVDLIVHLLQMLWNEQTAFSLLLSFQVCLENKNDNLSVTQCSFRDIHKSKHCLQQCKHHLQGQVAFCAAVLPPMQLRPCEEQDRRKRVLNCHPCLNCQNHCRRH